MSLEQKIDKLTAALVANTAAVKALAEVPTFTPDEAPEGFPAEEDSGTKPDNVSREDAQGALIAYAKKNGRPAAKELLNKQFEVPDLKSLPDDQLPALIEACVLE